jgi:hypothetical protein
MAVVPLIAKTPDPPYYAVIFTSRRTAVEEGYGDTSERMIELAAGQPGFLGVESARGADGLGITGRARKPSPTGAVARAGGVGSIYSVAR